MTSKEQAELVFTEKSKGKTYAAIANELNRRGEKTSNGLKFKPWNVSYFFSPKNPVNIDRKRRRPKRVKRSDTSVPVRVFDPNSLERLELDILSHPLLSAVKKVAILTDLRQ